MPRQTKKKLFLSVMALAVFAGGVAVVQISPWTDAAAQGAGAEQQAMPVPVVDIQSKPVQLWKEFSSRLVAVDYVEIRPQVTGIIEKVHFEDGQIVEKGDLLYTIDPRPYAAAVAQAKAELAAAKDDSEFAQKEFKRAEELLKTGAVSKQGYDERVNSVKNNKSAIASATARLKAAEVDLDNASIKAPIRGRISRPEITEGNLVDPLGNTQLMTTIVSDKEIYGDFEVDEQTYLNFVRAKSGQSVESEQAIPVKLSLPGDEKDYEGTIKSFDNKINASSGTIRARAIFKNDDNALLPGMFAKVEIGSTGEETLITVPEKAILTDQSRKFVYVVTDGTATYRELKLGDNVGHDRIVISGLQEGDKVIVDNLMKIRPGAKVQGMSQEQMDAMQAQQAQGAAPAGEAPKAQEPKKEEAKPAEKPAVETAPDAKEIPFEDPAVAPVPLEEPATPSEKTPVQE